MQERKNEKEDTKKVTFEKKKPIGNKRRFSGNRSNSDKNRYSLNGKSRVSNKLHVYGNYSQQKIDETKSDDSSSSKYKILIEYKDQEEISNDISKERTQILNKNKSPSYYENSSSERSQSYISAEVYNDKYTYFYDSYEDNKHGNFSSHSSDYSYKSIDKEGQKYSYYESRRVKSYSDYEDDSDSLTKYTIKNVSRDKYVYKNADRFRYIYDDSSSRSYDKERNNDNNFNNRDFILDRSNMSTDDSFQGKQCNHKHKNVYNHKKNYDNNKFSYQHKKKQKNLVRLRNRPKHDDNVNQNRRITVFQDNIIKQFKHNFNIIDDKSKEKIPDSLKITSIIKDIPKTKIIQEKVGNSTGSAVEKKQNIKSLENIPVLDKVIEPTTYKKKEKKRISWELI